MGANDGEIGEREWEMMEKPFRNAYFLFFFFPKRSLILLAIDGTLASTFHTLTIIVLEISRSETSVSDLSVNSFSYCLDL